VVDSTLLGCQSFDELHFLVVHVLRLLGLFVAVDRRKGILLLDDVDVRSGVVTRLIVFICFTVSVLNTLETFKDFVVLRSALGR